MWIFYLELKLLDLAGKKDEKFSEKYLCWGHEQQSFVDKTVFFIKDIYVLSKTLIKQYLHDLF